MILYLYKYTNKINGKCYIGQTNNLKRRHKQHLQDSFYLHKGHEVSHNCPIHAAIRKYGKENFNLEVLLEMEDTSREKINTLESEYIIKYNTLAPNGYNLCAEGKVNQGKNKSKIDVNIIEAIKKEIKENKITLSAIAIKYNLSESFISSINTGERLRDNSNTYPLRRDRNKLPEEQILEVQDMLKNTSLSMRKISKLTKRDMATISKINKGMYDIQKNTSKENIFPIRQTNKLYL